MKKIRTVLTLFYYGTMIAAVLVALLAYWLVIKNGFALDPASSMGLKISYAVMLYVIVSVPLSLGLFNKKVNKLKDLENKAEQERQYLQIGKWRMVCIGLGLLLGVFFFYLLQEQSLLFCAGIAAIALYFCKPTTGKIENDLAAEINSDIDEI